MDRFDDDAFFAELRALRPAPRPEFAAELDERVAAGFPRRDGAPAATTPLARLADRRRALSGRRRLVPVLAVALAALAIATAVVAIAHSGKGSTAADETAVGMVPGAGESGRAAEESAGTTKATAPNRHPGGGEAGYEAEAPGVMSAPSAEATAGAPTTPDAEVEESNGPAGTRRDIERSAYVVLGTKPGDVSGAAAKVYEAVHAAHGIVLHSKVQSGSSGAAGAYFELLIPSRKLDDALSSLSQIAEVRQRHDATDDITAPTVGAAEELRDSNASIESLLKELGDTETEAERESVEARLREERRLHAAIRARLDHLDKRASMSEVTVRVVSGHGAGVTPPGKGDGGWGVGDALHDAGHILMIAAGVTLIGLAVLGPIALILLALWLANRLRIRRLRERTLG